MKNKVSLTDPIDVNIVDQNKQDLESYAEEVVANRSVVWIYGFKPVHMLLLYCAFATTKIIKTTKKCARLIGDMLGTYHPHGDISTYDAILTMVNWYDCYMPLFKKQGNFGSFQGDGPASYRYTETCLTPFALECIIGDLVKTPQVVDWTKNYDESEIQPLYLPIKVPILLINGTDGIAVGMKADIPSHNFTEVMNATINLIDHPEDPVILKPDHCMPCEIVNTNWKAISNNGYGTYVVRSIIENGEYKGYPALFIRSLPNKTRLNPIKAVIEELKFTQLPQILSIHEDCTPTKLNCIIKFKKGTDLNYAKQILYKKTNLQKTFRVNFEVYNPDTHSIVRLSYKAYLQFFIEFRKNCLFRLYASRYQELITRIHALEMYITLSNNHNLDSIVADVRHNTSMDNNQMIEYLIGKYGLTDLQASFVIKNDVAKLAPYHIAKYNEELIALQQEANICYLKIVNEQELLKDIRQELVEIRDKYSCPRRCKLIKEADVIGIPEGTFKVIITEKNYICKIDAERNNLPKFKNDKAKFILQVENTDNLIIFDNKGKCYKLPVSKVSIHDGKSNGIDIRILIKDLVADICTIIAEERINELNKRIDKPFYLTTISYNGWIKKMELSEFLTVSVKGTIYSKVEENDIIQDIMIIPDNIDVIVYGKNKAIRFPMSDIPLQKRNTRGCKSMSSDFVDGISIVTSNTTDVVVITDYGWINRFSINGLVRSIRGTAGNKVIKLHKNDFIKVIYGVSHKDGLRVITETIDQVFPITDIPESSSISHGTKMIPTRETILRCMVVKNK